MKIVQLICAAAALLIGLSACNNIQYPEYIGTKDTRLDNISFKQTTLSTNLEYYNPNNFGIQIKETDLKIYIEGEYVGTADQSSELSIPAKSKFLFPVQIKFDGSKFITKALGLLFSNEVKYRVSGTAKVGKGKVFIKVPVNVEDKYIIRQ